MDYRSDGTIVQRFYESDFGSGWEDFQKCASDGEAYARAYLLNGGESE